MLNFNQGENIYLFVLSLLVLRKYTRVQYSASKNIEKIPRKRHLIRNEENKSLLNFTLNRSNNSERPATASTVRFEAK